MADPALIEAMARAIWAHYGYSDDPAPVVYETATAALAAHDAWLRSAGMAVVPVEPTAAMLQAGRHAKGTRDALLMDDSGEAVHDFVLAYRAMLAATGEIDALAPKETP